MSRVIAASTVEGHQGYVVKSREGEFSLTTDIRKATRYETEGKAQEDVSSGSWAMQCDIQKNGPDRKLRAFNVAQKRKQDITPGRKENDQHQHANSSR